MGGDLVFLVSIGCLVAALGLCAIAAFFIRRYARRCEIQKAEACAREMHQLQALKSNVRYPCSACGRTRTANYCKACNVYLCSGCAPKCKIPPKLRSVEEGNGPTLLGTAPNSQSGKDGEKALTNKSRIVGGKPSRSPKSPKSPAKQGRFAAIPEDEIVRDQSSTETTSTGVTAEGDVSISFASDQDIDDMNMSKELFKAIASGRVEEVNKCIQSGAKVDAFNRRGCTALEMAVTKGSEEIIAALLANRARLEARTSLGQTPLVLAATNSNGNITRMLLESGASVNKTTERFGSALHMAARASYRNEDSIGIAKTLLDFRADVNARDALGYTPFGATEEEGSQTMRKFLKTHGGHR